MKYIVSGWSLNSTTRLVKIAKDPELIATETQHVLFVFFYVSTQHTKNVILCTEWNILF